MWRPTARAIANKLLTALLFAVLLTGCDDGIVFFSTNFGFVVGDPDCHGGRFDMRDAEGLVIVVAFDSHTSFTDAHGQTAHCSDLTADDHVQVMGHRSADTIAAQSVHVL